MTSAGTPSTIAITGVDGFVGQHVAAQAHERGHRVVGLSRGPIADAALRAVLSDSVVVDLTERWPAEIAADAVIHLAGLAAVGPSFGQPQQYIETNSTMVTLMCEALLAARGHRTRIVGISSGAVYSAQDSPDPITELTPTAPTSPYAVSKLLVEAQLSYYATRGLDVIVARPFNHIGPGQGPGFLLPDLVDGVRGLAAGDPLRVGDLSTARDYTDVRDVARAYLMLAEAAGHHSTIYNVASGRSVTGLEMLEHAARALSVPVPRVEIDPGRIRSGDQARITGDSTRLREEFGWAPEFGVADSIEDYVRAALSASGSASAP